MASGRARVSLTRTPILTPHTAPLAPAAHPRRSSEAIQVEGRARGGSLRMGDDSESVASMHPGPAIVEIPEANGRTGAWMPRGNQPLSEGAEPPRGHRKRRPRPGTGGAGAG